MSIREVDPNQVHFAGVHPPRPGGDDPMPAVHEFRRAGLVAVLMALAATSPAAAQAPSDRLEIGAVELESLLDLQVAAVSLREERSSRAPASVFVVTAEDIRSQGFETLEEVLRSVPGLFGYRDGLYPMMGVRGLGLPSDYTTRLLVLVDGHPLVNSVGIGESYLGRDLPVPMSAVKRVEVIKGPVGSVYGPTAFLGVVNVVTHGPGAVAQEARLYAEGGQGRIAGGGAGGAWAGRFGPVSAAASFDLYASNGFNYRYPELALDTRPVPADLVVRGRDAAEQAAGYLRLGWGDFEALGGCGQFRRDISSAPYESMVGDPRTMLENLTCFGQLSVRHDLPGGLMLMGRLAYDDFAYHDAYGYDPPPDGYGLYRDDASDRWWSLEARADWTPSPATRLMAGLTGELHRTMQVAYSEQLPSLVEDPVNGVGIGPIRKDYATLNSYLLAEQTLFGTLRLHGGLTFYVHEIFGSRLTPKLAAVWQASRDDVAKLVYSEGFRAPAAAEAYFEDGTDYIGNLDLKPETVRSLEAIYERRVADVATVALSLFQNEYRNLIQFVTVPAPGVVNPDPNDPTQWRQQANNVGSLRLRGAELAVSVRWGTLLRAWGGIAWQEADQRTANFPELTGNLAVATRWPWKPLQIGVHLLAGAARAKDESAAIPGQTPAVDPYLLLGASATLDVPGATGLSVQLAASNLLDAVVDHPVTGDFTPISAIRDPARKVRLFVRYRP
jgi:iron complex outermembrane receptor protein